METPADHLTPESGSAPEKPRRRRHSQAFKARVLAEVLAGRESVSVIARRHDLNANMVFKWKRRHLSRHGGAIEGSATPLVPIQVSELPADPSTDSGPCGRIDIVLGADRWITVHGQVSREALRTALEVLAR